MSFRDRMVQNELEEYEQMMQEEHLMQQESDPGLQQGWNRAREFEGYDTFSQQDTSSPSQNKRIRTNESMAFGGGSSPKIPRSRRSSSSPTRKNSSFVLASRVPLIDAYSSKEARNYSSADMKAMLKLQHNYRNQLRKSNSVGPNGASPKKARGSRRWPFLWLYCYVGLEERMQRLLDTVQGNFQRLQKLEESSHLA